MYRSYLFCANYALFVLSTLLDRATHSAVFGLFLSTFAYFGYKYFVQQCVTAFELPEAKSTT